MVNVTKCFGIITDFNYPVQEAVRNTLEINGDIYIFTVPLELQGKFMVQLGVAFPPVDRRYYWD